LCCEELESRVTPSTLVNYSPTQIMAAYGYPSNLTGAGQTIAIIDAYKDSAITSDVSLFDTKYKLPAINLQVVALGNQANADWAVETSLDVEWVHAVAPGAKIVLVEAKTSSFADLESAITTAVTQYHATVVSMSWGGNEFATEASNDSVFKSYASSGVTFVASSGDTSPVEWPAASPYVLSVGGTSLHLSSTNTITSETGWNNVYGTSGGGVSKFETIPLYQNNAQYFANPYSNTNRTVPDVAYDADPATGFLIYSGGQLIQVGGTSDAAPQWAGIIALANQARANANPSAGTLSGYTQVLPAIYAMEGTNASNYFNDITSGGNATTGYDLSTGVGTPKVGNIITYLTGVTSFTLSAPTSSKAPTSPPPPNRNPFPFQFFLVGFDVSHTFVAPPPPAPAVLTLTMQPGSAISPAPVVASPFAGQLPAVNSPGSVFLPRGDGLSANNNGMMNEMPDDMPMAQAALPTTTFTGSESGRQDFSDGSFEWSPPDLSYLLMEEQTNVVAAEESSASSGPVLQGSMTPAVLASVLVGFNWHALTNSAVKQWSVTPRRKDYPSSTR